MGAKDHADRAEKEITSARCVVLTVSDTRKAETDESGRKAADILTAAGHVVADRRIVPNDRAAIVDAVRAALTAGVDLVVAIGGTGVSRRDVTVEAVRGLMEKELPGFGEMFRMLTAEEIGTAAIMTRATLGATSDGRLVVSTPGSTAGVRLALEDILVPQLKHLLWELRK
ncbi:MAG TPA: molybdenum cofactor biosynthesis protein B [Planctomycetota bacterium]|jgi:molybdopterin adenylyltransferase|nr:molybdenum cofactor biosynthesis protein B [Planctomycetota bacterium]